MSLCSDILPHIYHYLDFDTVAYLFHIKICKNIKSLITPHLGPLKLPRSTKASTLLSLFPLDILWPIISGTIVMDIPESIVPWKQVRYDSLVLLFYGVSNPEYLLPLFDYTLSHPESSLYLYDDNGQIAQAHNGYTSRAISYKPDPKSAEEYRYHLINSSKVFWTDNEALVRYLWPKVTHIWYLDDPDLYDPEHTKYPNIVYIRCDHPNYAIPNTWPKLKEMGPRVMCASEALRHLKDTPHPSLKILNIDAGNRDDLEAAFSLPYLLRLTVDKPLIPYCRELYGSMEQVIEFCGMSWNAKQ